MLTGFQHCLGHSKKEVAPKNLEKAAEAKPESKGL